MKVSKLINIIVIYFLNGDYMSQESTEDLTTQIISNSKEIMALLKRDNVELSEVDDYHKYPIVDNDTPQLSYDRLEYSLSNALLTYNLLEFDDIKEIYQDIEIQKLLMVLMNWDLKPRKLQENS